MHYCTLALHLIAMSFKREVSPFISCIITCHQNRLLRFALEIRKSCNVAHYTLVALLWFCNDWSLLLYFCHPINHTATSKVSTGWQITLWCHQYAGEISSSSLRCFIGHVYSIINSNTGPLHLWSFMSLFLYITGQIKKVHILLLQLPLRVFLR